MTKNKSATPKNAAEKLVKHHHARLAKIDATEKAKVPPAPKPRAVYLRRLPSLPS